jgi:alkyldihydroxyacetonephosphate synthase
MDYRFLGETFETSIEWSKIETMGEAVKQKLRDISSEYIKTTPFLSYRVSQCYNTGVCVYFTFGFYNDPENSVEQGIAIYHKMEKSMRETMTKYGGSISHHHGIGQVKADELIAFTDKQQLELHKRIKRVFDHKQMFCNNNYTRN